MEDDGRYIFWTLGPFYGHLEYCVVIWYIFPDLVFCTKKNLATLPPESTKWRPLITPEAISAKKISAGNYQETKPPLPL
jgi:hypothetical protein